MDGNKLYDASLGDRNPPPASLRECLWRGIYLRCPECGKSPVFVKIRKVRSLHDWFTPLKSCPRCGCVYEREAGYFLAAIWGVHFFAVAGAGLIAGLIADMVFHANLFALVLAVCLPALIFSLVFIRWSKSIYMAVDHLIEPRQRS